MDESRHRPRLGGALHAIVGAVRSFALTGLVALATFGLAFNDGTFAPTDRYAVAIGAWWAILLGGVLGVWPAARVSRAALATGGLLAAFGLLTAASIAWSVDTESAFDEVTRITAYLGAFVLAVVMGTRENVRRLADGVALGIVAIALLALAARLFPGWIDAATPEGVFTGDPRPSWPVGYWNALAVLTGLSLPLLLRTAVASRGPILRGVALAPIPALAALVYLTSSRSGVITAAVAVAAFLALTPQRGRAVRAIAVAGLGAAAATVLLAGNSDIVDAPFTSDDAWGQGRSMAIAIFAICVLAGLVHELVATVRVSVPRPSRRAKVAVAAAAAFVVIAGVVAANPSERFEDFKEPPRELGTVDPEGYTGSHITSTRGSGRWQLWSEAVDQWQESPVLGDGAGSFEAWWARHGDITYFARSAHSLYLEALAETGPLGLLLILGVLGGGIVAARRRLRATEGAEATDVAAIAAVVAGFAVAVALDWTWDLTVLPLVGLFALGLLTGPANGTSAPRARTRYVRVALAVAAAAIIAANALPLVVQTRIGDSREAATRGDTAEALDAAEDARGWQPWAASPYQQIALVHEQVGDTAAARTAIGDAIERDADDWRLWLVAARLEATDGDDERSQASFERALELFPRSTLLNSLEGRPLAP